MPPYPAASVVPAKAQNQGSGKGIGAIGWVGVSAAVVGAGLYGAAFATHSSYTTAVEAGDAPRIQALHGVTNGLTISGIGLLSGGASLFIVGAL